MTLTLEFEGTAEELIEIAEYQSEQGLDSHDLGDAMGFFITATMLEGDCEYSASMPGCDHLVTCTIEFDLFEWEGI